MKPLQFAKRRFQAGLGFAIIAAAICMLSTVFVVGADSASTNTVASAKPDAKAKKKKLTGSDLYAINCNRCHAERYPTEFNSAQWKTLMTHMRVRAGLPAKQAKEVLKYLQEESGN
jgi:cytochrome c5